eukprot:3704387-Pleurochrysis_carterae.AAC.1
MKSAVFVKDRRCLLASLLRTRACCSRFVHARLHVWMRVRVRAVVCARVHVCRLCHAHSQARVPGYVRECEYAARSGALTSPCIARHEPGTADCASQPRDVSCVLE